MASIKNCVNNTERCLNIFVRFVLCVALAAPAVAVETLNWASPGGNPDESSFSALSQIDSENISQLGLAWAIELPNESSLEATPLAVDGVLYFSGSYADVYAVEALTGKLLWKYSPEIWKHSPLKQRTMPVNRGVAYANGRIFVGAIDGRLIALNAQTGAEEWSIRTLDTDDAVHSSTGAPRTFNDKVIIGNSGADFGARGFVTAYHQDSGKQAWRFYTVPGSPEENKGNPAMERAAKTWSGEYWKTGTGGTVWNGMTFDPELNQIYLGVGNSGPYDPELRSPGDGDNLYLASIVAVDADTGEYVWHYQMNPREAWDYKCTANMISTTLEIDGVARKVLMQAPTNGFFYVLDRETGKLLSAEKIGKVTWADRIDLETGRPVERPNIRYETGESTIFPGTLGAHNFQAMSYSPLTGLVYIPYMQVGTRYSKSEPAPGEFALFGLTLTQVKEEEDDMKGALLAWDPIAQKQVWKSQHQDLWNGGTLATGGNLVFQGTADGHFSAYDGNTGERLWQFYMGQGSISSPSSYAIDGDQYVSVLAGYGATAGVMSDYLDVGWRYREHPRRLLTFKLGGKAQIKTTPRDKTDKVLDDPALAINDADVTAGRLLYGNCVICHGLALRSAGGPAPDLRESPMALTVDSLWAVLHDGALKKKGMPQFAELSRQQVVQLHAFIRAGARETLGLREPMAKQPMRVN